MAYDPDLADRIRTELQDEPGITERAMFGGLAFLCDGHLAIAASNHGGLLVRCEPEATEELLARPHVTPFEMRGTAMRGWLRVYAEAVPDADSLRCWIAQGVNFAQARSDAS